MPVTQAIPQTNLSGQQTFTFAASTQPWLTAGVLINRTGPGNHPWLNALTPADELDIAIQYSPDSGQTWRDCGGGTIFGGTVTTKGVTVTTTGFTVGIGDMFPTGTVFRVVTTASTAMTISGTVTYDTPT